MSDAARERRGRPPVESLGPKILDAARAHLSAVGVDAFSVRAVAELAGVSRKSIATRWESRDALLLDCLNHAAPIDFQPTGQLKEDLTELGTRFIQGLKSGALDLQLRVTADALTHPRAYRAMQEAVSAPLSRALGAAFRAAQSSGEVRGGDVTWLSRAFIGALLATTFSDPDRAVPTRGDLRELVSQVCAWAKA